PRRGDARLPERASGPPARLRSRRHTPLAPRRCSALYCDGAPPSGNSGCLNSVLYHFTLFGDRRTARVAAPLGANPRRYVVRDSRILTIRYNKRRTRHRSRKEALGWQKARWSNESSPRFLRRTSLAIAT